MPEILIIELEGRRERRRLASGRLSIGRGAGNDWVIEDPDPVPTLSRRHCVIEAGGDAFTITDLGSTNGTQLNERPIPAHTPTPLRPGDRLGIGRHVLRLAIEQAAPAPAGPPRLDQPAIPSAAARPAPARTARGEQSLDDILKVFGATSEPAELPGDAPAPSLDEDPLGGFYAERAPSRPPPRAPRERGATVGDHGLPQHQSLDRRGEPAPGRTAPAPPPPRAAAVAEDPLAAFLDGAGLAPRDLEIDDAQAFFRGLGRCFAAAADGLRLLLAARALAKDHAGIDRTVVRSAGNNPLKLSVSRREAVLALLRADEGYLPPLEAIEASVADLQAHELAVLEGMRAALAALLERFDPGELEGRLADASTLALLLRGGKRAQLWEFYIDRYADIAEAARRRFMGDFDRAFQEAYERKAAEFQRDARSARKP